jgi:uncharacterized oligopeptide transporter (OPT) family protein
MIILWYLFVAVVGFVSPLLWISSFQAFGWVAIPIWLAAILILVHTTIKLAGKSGQP